MPSGARKIAPGHTGSSAFRQNGANPPASTVAAQIVENLTQGQYPARQPDKEEFQRLLQEILNPDDDGDDIAESIETNVDVNCRLIYVVVRAGLESLSNPDGFEDLDEIHKQAIASLAVVQLTVRRSPEVLLSTLHGPQQVGSLYLWLVPRLFILLGSTEDYDIRRRICETVKTTLTAGKASFKQNKFLLIQKYLQGCIKGQLIEINCTWLLIQSNFWWLEDLLVFVEGPLSAHSSSTPAISQWCVPTMKTVMEVYPAELSDTDLKNSMQVCVKTLPQGCIILDCLLSTLAVPEAKSQRHTWKNDIMGCDYPWILNCLARLWNVIIHEKWNADDRLKQCVEVLLKTLTKMLDQIVKSSYELFLASKTAALLSQVICTVIFRGLGPSTNALEQSLSCALLELARTSARSRLILAGFQGNLLPVLQEIKEDQSRWNAFAVDLQVCSL